MRARYGRAHGRQPGLTSGALEQPLPDDSRCECPPIGLAELLDEDIEINLVLGLRFLGVRHVDVVIHIVGDHGADLAWPELLLRLPILAGGLLDDAAELVDAPWPVSGFASAPARVDFGDGLASLGGFEWISDRAFLFVVQPNRRPSLSTIILARREVNRLEPFLFS